MNKEEGNNKEDYKKKEVGSFLHSIKLLFLAVVVIKDAKER